jgi:hypothetical protein
MSGPEYEEFHEAICPGCKQVIDPTICYCGEPPEGDHDNHHFVPMGCRCPYTTDQPTT